MFYINISKPYLYAAKFILMNTMKLTDGTKKTFKDNDLKPQVERLFRDARPYLKHSYSLQELSDSLYVPLYRMSAFINQEYAMRFTDFVNLHRIGHAILLIQQGDAYHWSLDGLAGRCGFNNRNSFRDAFKRFTGQIPSEYLKRKQTLNMPAPYRKAG